MQILTSEIGRNQHTATTDPNENIKMNIYDLHAYIFIIRMSLRDVIFQTETPRAARK